MAEKVTIELEAKTKKAKTSLKDVIGSVGKLNESVVNSNKANQNSLKSLEKTTKSVSKGFKGVGLAMKAAGFGLILKVVDLFSESLSKNQQFANSLEVAMTAIGFVLKQITDVFVNVFKNVSDATGGFDALQKVLGGSLTIAINVVVGAIQGIILGVKKAQLAWEESFFGDKDPETIKRLQSEISEVGNKLDETGSKIKKAGGDIADNFIEAVGEVGTLAEGIASGVSDVIEKIDIKSAISQSKRVVQNKKNYAILESQSKRLIEQYDLEAETQRQIRDDDRKSISERISANQELLNVLNKQAVEEKKTIDARIQSINEQVRLEGESVELTKELYDLNTELIAIDAKVAGFKSEQLTNEASLQRENIELVNSKIESESNLGIERQRFNAELIEDEFLRLEALKEIDELEAEQEATRLQAIIDNENAGTQAKVDAQIALDEFNESSRQRNLERDNHFVNAQIELEKKRTQSKHQAFNQLVAIFGAESKLGRAALVGKQLLAAQELLIDLGVIKSKAAKAIAGAGLDTAESGSAVATGLAKTLKLGFPAAIPALIGYAATAVGIVGGVVAATKKTKSVASSMGGSGSVGNISAPPAPSIPKFDLNDSSSSSSLSAASQPAAFNVVGASDTNQLANAIGGQSQQPIQTYVVANEITTAQEMERSIIDGASI
jgi:hypothetical protein